MAGMSAGTVTTSAGPSGSRSASGLDPSGLSVGLCRVGVELPQQRKRFQSETSHLPARLHREEEKKADLHEGGGGGILGSRGAHPRRSE